MEFIKAGPEHLDEAEHIVHQSIRVTYGLHYPPEVVDFFLSKIHTRENIRRDIENHSLWMIRGDEGFVGTGCINGNMLSRVYILPEAQGKGYGTGIMDFLEQTASGTCTSVRLSPSLPAVEFYKKRGYVLAEHSECTLEHGVTLVHDMMEKQL